MRSKRNDTTDSFSFVGWGFVFPTLYKSEKSLEKDMKIGAENEWNKNIRKAKVDQIRKKTKTTCIKAKKKEKKEVPLRK